MALGRDLFQAVAENKRLLEDSLAQLKKERDNFTADIEKLGELLHRTREELTGYLLPDTQDEDLAALQKRIGYPGLLPIKQRYDEALKKSEEERKELESGQAFKEADITLAETEEELNGMKDVVERVKADMEGWQGSKWFRELDGRGYFQLEYKAARPFVRFRDWRAISLYMRYIEKTFTFKLRNSGDAATRYRKVKEDTEAVLGLHQDFSQRRQAILDLKGRHEGLVKAPERLFQEMYRELGRAIMAHFDSLPEAEKGGISTGDKNLRIFLKKQAGLSKQIGYLGDLVRGRLEPEIQAVTGRMAKLEYKMAKARRKWDRDIFSPDEVRKYYEDKPEKWLSKQEKLARLRQRIYGFDRYEQGSFSHDFLWWALLTNTARGEDIAEVRVFNESHPGWDYKSYRDPWEPERAHGGGKGRAIDSAAGAIAADMSGSPDSSLLSDAS